MISVVHFVFYSISMQGKCICMHSDIDFIIMDEYFLLILLKRSCNHDNCSVNISHNSSLPSYKPFPFFCNENEAL